MSATTARRAVGPHPATLALALIVSALIGLSAGIALDVGASGVADRTGEAAAPAVNDPPAAPDDGRVTAGDGWITQAAPSRFIVTSQPQPE